MHFQFMRRQPGRAKELAIVHKKTDYAGKWAVSRKKKVLEVEKVR